MIGVRPSTIGLLTLTLRPLLHYYLRSRLRRQCENLFGEAR
jgi:hypothetical protein